MIYHFDADLAVKIGVDEAIMMNNIAFWIQHNIANEKHFYEGRYWTYNTVQAFADLYPFWTTKQLRRIMESLYQQNVLIKGNFNKKSFDRTGWYAITDEYSYLMHLPKRANDLPEQANGNAQKGKAIPNRNTDNASLFHNDIPTKRFKSPDLEEVLEYFKLLKKEEGAARRFFNFYTSNGWVVGRTKMKDWQAAANNWAEDKANKKNSHDDRGKNGMIKGVSDLMTNFNDI